MSVLAVNNAGVAAILRGFVVIAIGKGACRHHSSQCKHECFEHELSFHFCFSISSCVGGCAESFRDPYAEAIDAAIAYSGALVQLHHTTATTKCAVVYRDNALSALQFCCT